MINNKLNKVNKVRQYINILYIIFNSILGFYILINLFEADILDLPLTEYFTIIFIFCLIFILIYFFFIFINIILHEFGHLVFGLFAKLRFISFNILCFTFSIRDNKLSVKQNAFIPGVYGYCCMEADDNIDYNSNKIKLYYIGGIIFHLISIIVNTIGLILINNCYFDFIFIINISINLYLAIYNSLPYVDNSGAISDALHLIYYSKDNNYIKTVSKLNKLQRLILTGTELKDIDSSFFTKPKTFDSLADILNGKFYIEYIMSKGKYKETVSLCKKMLKDEKKLLTKQDIISIKLQLILATFYLKKNLTEIKDIWDEDIKKHLDLMSNYIPQYIGINYMYFSLVEENNDIANKCLNQFKKINRKKYDKYQIKELEQLMFDVNKYNKKNH